MERDIALAIDFQNSDLLNDIGETIESMRKRLSVLKEILHKEENPEKNLPKEDFVGFIIIKSSGN